MSTLLALLGFALVALIANEVVNVITTRKRDIQ